jgi:hypothetical protein
MASMPSEGSADRGAEERLIRIYYIYLLSSYSPHFLPPPLSLLLSTFSTVWWTIPYEYCIKRVQEPRLDKFKVEDDKRTRGRRNKRQRNNQPAQDDERAKE